MLWISANLSWAAAYVPQNLSDSRGNTLGTSLSPFVYEIITLAGLDNNRFGIGLFFLQMNHRMLKTISAMNMRLYVDTTSSYIILR
jgi:hypothetical protein